MINSKRSVLFLCTGNSARSQMAEALLNYKAGDKFTAFSAGTHPEVIDKRAVIALSQFGIDTNNLAAKNVKTLADQSFDFVITLCDKASNECRNFPHATKQYAWDFPDPKARLGSNPFATTLNELNNRLSMFLLVEEQNLATPTLIEQPNLPLAPIDFYKNFTDEIRLKVLMLSHYHGELCVCELMESLTEESQPKVSRNLALLRKSNILTTRKHGQWVFYRLNPELPLWAKLVIAQTTENNIELISEPLQRLADMKNRPSKTSFCK